MRAFFVYSMNSSVAWCLRVTACESHGDGEPKVCPERSGGGATRVPLGRLKEQTCVVLGGSTVTGVGTVISRRGAEAQSFL